MKHFLKKVWKWLDNYWYHYKWVTVIGAVFLCFVVIGLVQLLGRDAYDAHIIYCGPTNLAKSDYAVINQSLAATMPGDFSGDGKLTPDFTDIVYVPSRLAVRYQEAGINYDYMHNAQSLSTFQAEMMNGQCLICLLDEEVYLQQKENDMFRTLSDVLGKAPEKAYDDCAIYLANTDFWGEKGVKSLPDDTVVCLRIKNSVSGSIGSDWDAVYAYHEQMFINMVTGSRDVVTP